MGMIFSGDITIQNDDIMRTYVGVETERSTFSGT